MKSIWQLAVWQVIECWEKHLEARPNVQQSPQSPWQSVTPNVCGWCKSTAARKAPRLWLSARRHWRAHCRHHGDVVGETLGRPHRRSVDSGADMARRRHSAIHQRRKVQTLFGPGGVLRAQKPQGFYGHRKALHAAGRNLSAQRGRLRETRVARRGRQAGHFLLKKSERCAAAVEFHTHWRVARPATFAGR